VKTGASAAQLPLTEGIKTGPTKKDLVTTRKFKFTARANGKNSKKKTDARELRLQSTKKKKVK